MITFQPWLIRATLVVVVFCTLGATSPTPKVVTAPATVVAPEPNMEVEPVRVVQDGPVRVEQTGPITFKLPLSMLIGWMVTIAAGLTAIAVIWRYGTKAAELLVKAKAILSNFERNGAVLDAIAKEFKSDSGSTLKDAINRIEAATNVAQTSAATAKAMAERLEKLLADHMKSVEQKGT